MLQAVSENAENQGFNFGYGFLAGSDVSECAGEFRSLGDPAAIFFLSGF